jgi:ammonium transporter, Amt family
MDLSRITLKRALWPAAALLALGAVVLWSAPVFAQGNGPSGDAALAAAEDAKLAVNLMWMLIAAFMVFLMQVGFALVGAGFTRAKNVVHTMMMNLIVFCIAALGYWAVGFALQFGAINTVWPAVTTPGAVPGGWTHAPITLGNWGDALSTPLLKFGEQSGFLGGSGFGLSNLTLSAGVLAFFTFQLVFMNIAATIPNGAMAERFKFSGFALMALFVSMFLYPLVGGWVWGGGWLQNLGRTAGLGNGAVDFAGSGVVHMVGGTIALAGAIALGPRYGRFNANGSLNPIPGHNIPLGVIGSLILFFGWFGLTSGSAYGMTGAFGQLAANAVINTLLAGAAGGVAAMLYSWAIGPERKPDVTKSVNGVLSGLVAITASCAFVESGSAVLIGLIAGVLMCVSTRWLERLRIDDAVGAVPVHLVNGIWGLLSAGIFSAGLSITRGWNGMGYPVTGLLFGNTGQLTAQLIEVMAIFATVFVLATGFFMLLRASDLLRVARADEIAGLDVSEMGTLGYSDEVAETPPQQPDNARAALRPQLPATTGSSLDGDLMPSLPANRLFDAGMPSAPPSAPRRAVQSDMPGVAADIAPAESGPTDATGNRTPRWSTAAGRPPSAAQGIVPDRERFAPSGTAATAGRWSRPKPAELEDDLSPNNAVRPLDDASPDDGTAAGTDEPDAAKD